MVEEKGNFILSECFECSTRFDSSSSEELYIIFQFLLSSFSFQKKLQYVLSFSNKEFFGKIGDILEERGEG